MQQRLRYGEDLYEKSAKGFPVFDTDSAVWTEHDRADRGARESLSEGHLRPFGLEGWVIKESLYHYYTPKTIKSQYLPLG